MTVGYLPFVLRDLTQIILSFLLAYKVLLIGNSAVVLPEDGGS